MDAQSWILILVVGMFIFIIGFLIAIGFIIYVSLEIKRASNTFEGVLKNLEVNLNPVLEEARESLKSIRKVSDDLGTASENVKHLSVTIYNIASNLEILSSMIDDIRRGASLRVMGLKAGIKAALNTLIKHERKEGL